MNATHETPPLPELAELVWINEAVKQLRISLRQGYRWIHSGRIRGYKVGGRLYVHRDDLRASVVPVTPKRHAAADEGKTPKNQKGEIDRWKREVLERARI